MEILMVIGAILAIVWAILLIGIPFIVNSMNNKLAEQNKILKQIRDGRRA